MKNTRRLVTGLGLVAALSLGGIANAQSVNSKLTTREPRLRATGLFATAGISHTRILQPWIPLELHSPFTNVAPIDPSYPDNPFYFPLVTSTGTTTGTWVAPTTHPITDVTTASAAVIRPLAAFVATGTYRSVNNLVGQKSGLVSAPRSLLTFGSYHRLVTGTLDTAFPALGSGVNSDGDSKRDIDDDCPLDPEKETPGKCGCGYQETDGDATCTDPTAAEQTTDGGTSESQLRVLLQDDGKQYRATGYRVKSSLGKSTVRVRLDIALPRFPNADDLLFQSDEQADQVIIPAGALGIDNTRVREGGGLNIATWFDTNGDRAVDAGEVETFFNTNLAEEADRVAYSCGLQKRSRGGDFKLISNMKELEKNQNGPGGAAGVRRYAFPQWTTTTAQDDGEYRFRCIAENKNSGLSSAFTSNPFGIKSVKVK